MNLTKWQIIIATACMSFSAFTSAQPLQKNNLFAGDISKLAVSPTHQNELFATADKAGIFQSVDNGTTWQHLDIPTFLTNNPHVIAINPNNGDEIFIGTDDGIYKSTNDGKTWKVMNNGLAQGHIRAIAINPQNPNEIYVAVDKSSLYKSTDGGKKWKVASTGLGTYYSIDLIAINPQKPATLMIGIGAWIAKSIDAGAHWNFIQNIPDQRPENYPYARKIVFVPNSERVYLSAKDGLYIKDNDASDWIDISPTSSAYPASNLFGLIVNSANPNTLYVSQEGSYDSTPADGIYYSNNGGKAWNKISSIGGYSLMPDKKNANSFFMISQYAEGVYHSNDAGKNWQSIVNGLPLQSTVHALAADLKQPATLYAGTEKHGIWKTEDGLNWKYLDSNYPKETIESLAVNPTNSKNVIAGFYAGRNTSALYISWDAGITWQPSKLPKDAWMINNIVFNPIDTNEIWAETWPGAYLIKSNDSGKNWQIIIDGSGDEVRRLQINSLQPSELFVYKSDGEYQSLDGGATWHLFSVNEIKLDSFNPNIMYQYVKDESSKNVTLMQSLDHGVTWEIKSAGLNLTLDDALPLNDPQSPNNLFILPSYSYSTRELYMSFDQANHWQMIDNVPASLTSKVISNHTLYMATYDDGIYSYLIPSPGH